MELFGSVTPAKITTIQSVMRFQRSQDASCPFLGCWPMTAKLVNVTLI